MISMGRHLQLLHILIRQVIKFPKSTEPSDFKILKSRYRALFCEILGVRGIVILSLIHIHSLNITANKYKFQTLGHGYRHEVQKSLSSRNSQARWRERIEYPQYGATKYYIKDILSKLLENKQGLYRDREKVLEVM